MAHAQFVVDGTERPFLKWYQIKTEDYRFVFPAEMDSLARVYAGEWERWKLPVSRSIGFVPNEGYKLRMPVILHPYLGYSNGMVVWTPRRMEMYTGPDMYTPDPIVWSTVLSIHEQRHVSQMQFLKRPPLKMWSYLSGEALAGFFSVFYLEPSHFEGDAVAAETGLTDAGRARTADFLEYYRASFDVGQFRNYERWRYGSQRRFTPDYYKVGYLAIGGMRAVYDKPLFMKDYYDWLIPYRKQVKRQTHMKFKDAFGGIMAVQDSLWRTDDEMRAPFQPLDRLTKPGRYYASFSGLAWSDGKIYATRAGIADDKRIVSINPVNGKVHPLHLTSADSPLTAGGDKLYWSEVTYDPRWEMHSNSSIRYLKNGGTRTLVRRGRWFNPKAYGDTLAVCRTDYDGSAYVCLLAASDGAVLEEFRSPDGMTPYEAVIKGGEIFCAAITDGGEGIYRLPSFAPVLEPSFVKINHLFVFDDKLFFTSDRTGVNELYSLDAGSVLQHTNLKAGGQDFVFGDDGQLYFTYLRTDGRMICRTPVDSLPVRAIDFVVRHRYELEDKLSAQEAALAAAAPADTAAPRIGAPRRYSKLAHAIKVHSWMPFYADYDELTSMSFENLTTALGLGATAYFQNDLNTFYGSAAYSYIPGMLMTDRLSLHSGIIDVTYRGLYSVFEGKVIANRGGVNYRVRSYVPLNFSSDGWTRGVIPYAEFVSSPTLTTVGAGLRAYSMRPTLNSCIYPRWGIGADVGAAKDFDFIYTLQHFAVYAYTPGFTKTSGFRFSIGAGTEPYTDDTIKKSDGVIHLSQEATLSYAIPFLSIDWNGLSPIAYIRNFEFIPKLYITNESLAWDRSKHPDYATVFPSFFKNSIGASLQAVLGNLWFIPYNFRIGVSAAYVWGNKPLVEKPYEIKLVLNTDLL
ncbi:MAG: hypothetical protein J5748_06550 [Bacteroidales bacterium]|nr:hypothetical protein [Bacteroidales bacterium]